jgi:hypothetical protein
MALSERTGRGDYGLLPMVSHGKKLSPIDK